MNCLFCSGNGQFNTVEHIIPESLGNDDLVLQKEICDSCQNYLSQNENYVLANTPVAFWRTFLSIKTKKRKFPKPDLGKSRESKGRFPDSHPLHDNVKYIAHQDFTTEVILPVALQNEILETGQGKAKYVITPRVIFELGRFLGKIGLELVCKSDPLTSRTPEFDLIRKYVRYGTASELWPLFYTTCGTVEDLFLYSQSGEDVKEDVVCYSFKLLKVGNYFLFNLATGTDSWLICLNDMYPSPVILEGFPSQQFKLIWYSKQEWEKG
jgi:hypothetical protein